MTARAVFTRSFRVGRYRVEVTLPTDLEPGTVRHAVVEWTPVGPDRLSPAEQQQYTQRMAALLAQYAAEQAERSPESDR